MATTTTTPPSQGARPCPITTANLKFITSDDLAAKLLATSTSTDPAPGPSIAIVDVRDEDRRGGHIAGSHHCPSRTLLDVGLPELARRMRHKHTVVFHCMLSQQRGPRAALAYARYVWERRERQRLEKGEEDPAKKKDSGADDKDDDDDDLPLGQELYVLEGGFSQWQETYGMDEKLTAEYEKEGWDAQIFS